MVILSSYMSKILMAIKEHLSYVVVVLINFRTYPNYWFEGLGNWGLGNWGIDKGDINACNWGLGDYMRTSPLFVTSE